MNDYQANSSDFKQRLLLFENWISQRFISECDFTKLSVLDALAWSKAMLKASNYVAHEVVPFRKGGCNE